MNTGTVFNAFAFNGTVLNLQPSTHKWADSDVIGIDGGGRGIYPAYREYELKWDLMSTEEFRQVYNAYLSIGQTGSVVAALPKLDSADYEFYNYSGCVLRKPTMGNYFQNWISDVTLLVVRVLV